MTGSDVAALTVEGLVVTYRSGHRALDGVDLEVPSGARRAVVGRSGSGKTTLVRAVLGLLPAGTSVTGSIRVAGQEVVGAPETRLRAMRGRLVGHVPQDPYAACDPLRTVAHHLREPWRAHRLTPPESADDLDALGVDDAARRVRGHPHTWSGGMLQRATLAAATAHRPPVLLADEPSSALDTELADDMLRLVVARSGALLLISHDLALVARHTDHVTVLDAGRVAEHGPAAELLVRPRATATVGLVAAAGSPPPRPRTVVDAPVVAGTSGVTRRYGRVTALADVSMAVRRGEVVGIVGRSGSGKSTLLRLLAGLETPDRGAVQCGGEPGHVMPVFQDAVASLDRRWPLWRTLVEPLRARGERVPRRAALRAARAMLDRVGLGDVDPTRRPGTLSVGQAQRVAIARALAARPGLLLADEPTASLDVGAAAEITALLREVADDGVAVLVVSHDPVRLASYADRVLRMSAGRLEPEDTRA